MLEALLHWWSAVMALVTLIFLGLSLWPRRVSVTVTAYLPPRQPAGGKSTKA